MGLCAALFYCQPSPPSRCTLGTELFEFIGYLVAHHNISLDAVFSVGALYKCGKP
jgi:hypothetical protein